MALGGAEGVGCQRWVGFHTGRGANTAMVQGTRNEILSIRYQDDPSETGGIGKDWFDKIDDT